MNEEKVVVERVICPAIRGQNCPICLKVLRHRRSAVIAVCKHGYCVECIRKWSDLKRNCPLCNAHFDSWFCNISLSSRTFLTHRLPPLTDAKTAVHFGAFRSGPRVRARQELCGVNRRRTTPLPLRRSFGRPGSVPPHVVAERKLEWRASIYNRCLQAIPVGCPRNSSEQIVLGNNYAKERVRQRIEPWIQRELRSLLGDLDTSIIVHMTTSLFISSVEGRFSASSRQHGVQDDFLAPLRSFLHDRTNVFWHELRCFAESSLTMETYDAVVAYKMIR